MKKPDQIVNGVISYMWR